jgi:hypothetical protein
VPKLRALLRLCTFSGPGWLQDRSQPGQISNALLHWSPASSEQLNYLRSAVVSDCQKFLHAAASWLCQSRAARTVSCVAQKRCQRKRGQVCFHYIKYRLWVVEVWHTQYVA